MRRPISHLFAVCLLGLAANQLQGSPAQACIKFDRAAEIALIDGAIAAPATAPDTKTKLTAYRQEMASLAEKTDSNARAQYGDAVWKALELIGKKRIVWDGKSDIDAGVFKKSKQVKRATRTAEAQAEAAVPSCG